MLLTTYRVRQANGKGGIVKGLLGTVVGDEWIKNPESGQPLKIYHVLWYNYDEETGEETLSDRPAPDAHTATELRAAIEGFADEAEFEDEEDLDEDEDEDEEDLKSGQINHRAASI